MTTVVGIDGVGPNWLAIQLDGLVIVDAVLVDDLDTVPAADRYGIDMFVALGTSGPREVDRWCRRQVGKLTSSVFNAPPRSIVVDEGITSYDEARARIDPSWPGLSIQTWGLVPKIRDVRRFVRTRTAPVHEVHPEVCFAVLAGAPMTHRKKTWKGQRDRLAVLATAGLDMDSAVLDGVGGCPPDDVLDAAVVALTCHLAERDRASLAPAGELARVLAPT